MTPSATNSRAAEVIINHVSAETRTSAAVLLIAEGVIRPVFSVSVLAWFIRTSAAVLLVAEGVIRPVFSVSALTWFIRTSAAVVLVAEGACQC
jgi:hypothetical protein